MSTIRNEEHYFAEVHYTKIKGADSNPAFRVASRWLALYFTFAVRHCPFKAFIVEDGPFQSFPYPGEDGFPEHAERSLLSAFFGGIAWSYAKAHRIRLRPIFDDSDNEIDKATAFSLPEKLESAILQRRLLGRRYPIVEVEPSELVASKPSASGDHWGDAEFVQLCDLLLGASFDALELAGRTRQRAGRLRLAKSLSEVLSETLRLPWHQRLPVHRRVSISLYPDQFNKAYPAALWSSQPRPAEPGIWLPGFELPSP